MGSEIHSKQLKEAKERKTYETAVNLNLDTSVNRPTPRTRNHIERLLENISDNELHEYEKLVLSYYAQNDWPKLTYDPNKTYTFFFDTETTCSGNMQNFVSCPPFLEIETFQKTFTFTITIFQTLSSCFSKLFQINRVKESFDKATLKL